MAKISSCNGFIATEPFPTREIRATVKSAFAVVEQRKNLTPLKVLFDSENVKAGATIYVRGDDCKAPWAGNVMELDGMQFILVPKANVVLVQEPSE